MESAGDARCGESTATSQANAAAGASVREWRVSDLLGVGLLDVPQIAALIANAGFPTAVAIFLMWQLPKREDKLNAKIADLEAFHKQTLLSLVERNAELLSRNQDVLDRCIKSMDGLERHLERLELEARGK